MRIPVMRVVLLLAIVPGTGATWAKPSVSELREQLKAAQGDDLLGVIKALGESHSGQAVQPLLEIFDVPHIGLPEARYIAMALGELRDARAVPYLSNAWIFLKSSGLEDRSMPVEVVARSQLARRAIVDALGKIGGDGVIDILVEAARGDGDFLIVEHACQALRRLKPKAMVGLNCPNPS
jgi:hypothetical protein